MTNPTGSVSPAGGARITTEQALRALCEEKGLSMYSDEFAVVAQSVDNLIKTPGDSEWRRRLESNLSSGFKEGSQKAFAAFGVADVTALADCMITELGNRCKQVGG